MNRNINFDYTSHYESVLLTKDEIGKVKAAEFINFFSDLVLKYHDDIEKKNMDVKRK
ncbi:hypothetical protein J7I93_03675 [Bacillus sp. ISL-47]|uniref:hypothetical protein n=1 Tax=Bacillus sp. ISL-47 TaxID=2819130 RepID=UPI001BEC611B|nr:hypothetical protein [Bacillus sp. ISL-47]MBT2687276.1 hypothetical protein [Bacillus sp. ISL-47]MBT2706654.1 hypothetical protein [Pseudomonas sp. ISL-84]